MVLAASLMVLPFSAATVVGEEEATACKINKVKMPEIIDTEKIATRECPSAYYSLCENMVEQAQDNCADVCQRFNKRSSRETLILGECSASLVGTTIDAYSPETNCTLKGEDWIVSCTLSYDCSCNP